MSTQTSKFIALWEESRTRLENQLPAITSLDLHKKLRPSPNSVGFLLRHIAEVELLFAKNVFGSRDVKIIAKTVIAKHDTGEWTDLESLLALIETSRSSLAAILKSQQETDWDMNITTPEFGTKTKAQALARIISHTAYHAGQLRLLRDYGNAQD